jgi:hypothetical protein
VTKSKKVLGRSGYSQSLSQSTLFSPKNTLFWPNNRETGSPMTARTTIQSSRTAQTVVDRKEAVSAGIFIDCF